MVAVTRPSSKLSRTQQLRLVALASVIAFASLWGFVLWRSHSSLIVLHPPFRGAGIGIGPQLLSSKSNLAKSSAVAPVWYDGWQPAIPTESSCSWRTCFQKTHQCPACRDLPEDLAGLPEDFSAGKQWIPDVTMLHRMRLLGHDSKGNPWPPVLPDELCEDIGGSGGKNDDNRALLDKIPIRVPPLTPKEQITTPKVLCMVYTMKEQHATNIRAIRETWASHCDGFLAFSTADDPRLPAISLPHAGKEEYNNMWQKVRSIWKFVGTNYLEEFDFFFQGGEDLFVIPQNLKRYLKDLMDQDGKNSDDDFFVGRRFKGYDKDNYFNSGGAGYALSRGTLRKYITEGWEHPSCDAKTHSAMEDVMIARCLRNVFGIGLTDTRDSSLRERFHPFAPASHFFWRPPTEGNKDWYQDYNEEWPPLLGEQCCAPDSVSFHYIKKPAMVRHLHAILNSCPRPTVPRVLDANGSDDNEDGDDGNGSSDGDGDDGDGDDQNDGAD